MKCISILSGGMDSATALAWVIQNNHQVVSALNFWYGSKHNDREWEACQKIAAHYGIEVKQVKLDFVAQNFQSDLLKTGGPIPEGHYEDPSMKKTVVPFRNGIMLSIAAGYAESVGADELLLGNHHGDHAIYPDCREEFITPMREAIYQGTYAKIKISTPFINWSKTDIARYGNEIEVPFELTYSCYNGGEYHCGRCGTCYERKEAFSQAGIIDRTGYEK